MNFKDRKITKFLEEIAAIDPVKHEIATELYTLFTKLNPEVKDKFIYGGIGMYLNDNLIGGIWIYANHVSLIFSEGYKINDKYNKLEGGGKYRRHIKIEKFEQIRSKKSNYYIKEMYRLY